jgi:hypothetical protein
MIFLCGEMFPEKPHDEIDQFHHFVIGEALPEHFHQLIIGKFLKIDCQGGFIPFPGKAKGQGPPIGLDESMGMTSHGGFLLPPLYPDPRYWMKP